MVASLIYFANILSALFFFMILALTVSLGIYVVTLINQYMASKDEEQYAKEKGKKIRKKWLPLLLASIIWLTFVPDGKTFLMIKGANAIGDEHISEFVEIIENKLIQEIDETIEYD